MANIETIASFEDNVTPLNAEVLNKIVVALNALIDAHNNGVTIETSDNILSIADANGNEIVRLNNNLEVKANGDLYVAGTKIN